VGDWMRSFRYWIRGKWFRRAVREVVGRVGERSQSHEPARPGKAGQNSADEPGPPTTRHVNPPL